MRTLMVGLVVVLTACSAPAVAAPAPTEDPRIADLTAKLGAEQDAHRAENAEWLGKVLAAQVEANAASAARDRVQCCGTFLMWANRTETLRPDTWGVVSVPDTFTLRIKYTATAPVRARIVTLPQFVRLMNGMTVDAPTWGPTTALDVEFHEAEGCADYVLILDVASETVFRPEISITRHVSQPTGVCAN